MIAVVVPAKNEGPAISKVLNVLSSLPVNLIIPVVNGCCDNTLDTITNNTQISTIIVYSKEPLGPDVPRAIGAKTAYDHGADLILFVDGDMQSNATGDALDHLIKRSLAARLDFALSDCYPETPPDNSLAELVVYFRHKLNIKIGCPLLKSASPSHGPHMISRRLLEDVPFEDLAIPPVSLAKAAKIPGMKIDIGVKIPHHRLGSPYRNHHHARNMAKTIIGDYIEAMNFFDERPRNRTLFGKTFIGYHNLRNWTLLDRFLKRNLINPQIVLNRLS